MKNIIHLALAMSFMIALALPTKVVAQDWSSDQMHSSVLFSVHHILTPFIGNFEEYSVAVSLNEDDLENASIKASINPASIATRSDERDKHLKSAEFFDVEASPDHWTFTSTQIEKTGENEYLAKGEMTAKGKTVALEIPFKFLGTLKTKRGKKAGITAEFIIKRSDFGLGNEMGGMLGDEVKIMAYLEMNGK